MTLKAEVLVAITARARWKGPHDSPTQGSGTNPAVWRVAVSWHCQTPSHPGLCQQGQLVGTQAGAGSPLFPGRGLHERLLTWKGLVYLFWWVA